MDDCASIAGDACLSLVGELRYCMLYSVVKINKQKVIIIKKQHFPKEGCIR